METWDQNILRVRRKQESDSGVRPKRRAPFSDDIGFYFGLSDVEHGDLLFEEEIRAKTDKHLEKGPLSRRGTGNQSRIRWSDASKTEQHDRGVPDIFTTVFLYQLMITLLLVIVINHIQSTFYYNRVDVNDSKHDFHRYERDFNSEVQNAIEDQISEVLVKKVPGRVQTEVDKIRVHVTNMILTEVDGKIRQSVEREIEDRLILNDLSDIDRRIKDIDTKFEKASDEVKAINDELKKIRNLFDEQSKIVLDLKQYQDGIDQRSAVSLGNIAATNRRLRDLENKFLLKLSANKRSEQSVKHLQSPLKDQRATVEGLLDEITVERDHLVNLMAETEQLNAIYMEKVSQLNALNSTLKEIQRNVFNKDKFIIAFMILVAMVMLLAVCVFCLWREFSDYSERSTTQISADHNAVLRQIPRTPVLESGVCIISFDESRTMVYRHILDSANIPNCRIQEHVIRRQEHIPTLPRCKVYLMCTEFYERKVMKEEPVLGLGDLHWTTYDAVQKLGGYLIILYTRDPESRWLNGKSLYNTNIRVTHQPELSIMNDDGRFLSIYDKLTDHQKTHLRNKIVQNIT